MERELCADDRRRTELERASLLAELNAKDRRQRADAESRLRELDNPLVFVTSGDATPEVLVDLLARGQVHGLTVASAEGVILQHMAGLYKDGAANLDVYLQAHGGEPVKVHRKHQPLVEIARPLLALALATQPVTVFDARANRQIAGRGILQRILWSVPPDNVGYRDTYPRPLDPSVPEVWRTVYRQIGRAHV